MEDILAALKRKYPKESDENLRASAEKIYIESQKIKAAEEQTKASEKTFSTIGDKEFFEMFHGMNMITGSGKGYVSAFEYLQKFDGPMLKRIFETCLIVNEKPKMLLMTGKTKSGKGEGKVLDPRLADLLPKLTDDEWTQMSTSENEKDKVGFAERMKYQENWQYVNFSMVRRIAIMAIEHRVRTLAISPVFGQIYAKYPSGYVEHEFTLANCGNSQGALDAKKESQNEVTKAKPFWKDLGWKTLLSNLEP